MNTAENAAQIAKMLREKDARIVELESIIEARDRRAERLENEIERVTQQRDDLLKAARHAEKARQQ